VIADELSLGLAPIITDEVYGVLARIKASGAGLVVIEQHVRHALEVADLVVVLDRGQIVYSGPTGDLDSLMAAFRTETADEPVV
jgi:branched-chain amino acid transport system ATP-binding protein